MIKPNTAIKRIRHVIPTMEELWHDFKGCKIFSKIDLNQGYHQLLLDESSRAITTFRHKRLNFGTCLAAEIFHEEVRKKLVGILLVRNLYDDILSGGRDEISHNENLETLFGVCCSNNITLKLEKCKFGQKSVKVYGMIFSESGIHPDPEKVESLRRAETPKDKNELRSFLGMINFSSPFIKNYSTLTYEL